MDTKNDWLKNVIEGPSGMNAYERHEMVSWNESDRMAAARWVIGCLANPRCAGSAEMLQAIQGRREERMANVKGQTRSGGAQGVRQHEL